jgi:hypothetical protein
MHLDLKKKLLLRDHVLLHTMKMHDDDTFYIKITDNALFKGILREQGRERVYLG